MTLKSLTVSTVGYPSNSWASCSLDGMISQESELQQMWTWKLIIYCR